MFSTIIWNPDLNLFSIGSFSLRWYSLCWMLAFISAYIVLRGVFRREGIKEEKLVSLAVYVFIGTFLGARLVHCLFYDWEYFLAHPVEILIPFKKMAGRWVFTGYAGLASHGGAVGILVALWLYARKNRMKFFDLTDKLGLVAPLSGAFIRIGNFMNSEIIGKETDMPWGVVFDRIDTVPRHPSQLYEALACIVIFVVVYRLYTRLRGRYKAGYILGVSIACIFVSRFLIEYTKEVQVGFEEGLRQTIGMDMGQLLSLPFIIAGVILIIMKRPAKSVGGKSSGNSKQSGAGKLSGDKPDESVRGSGKQDDTGGLPHPTKPASRYEHYYKKK